MQNSRENSCVGFSILKNLHASGMQLYQKKRLWHRYFPVNSAEFLRTFFFQNNFRQLLLNFTNENKASENEISNRRFYYSKVSYTNETSVTHFIYVCDSSEVVFDSSVVTRGLSVARLWLFCDSFVIVCNRLWLVCDSSLVLVMTLRRIIIKEKDHMVFLYLIYFCNTES